MTKKYMIIAAIMGALGVVLGAFGTHGLRSILPPDLLETYKTGILYHLIHSVVLLAIALNSRYDLKFSFIFILIGILLFSFSLYLYSIFGLRFFTFITPFGGICLILGWFYLILTIIKK